MENLGDVFRKAREEKNLTIKDVSLQTNIGSKFIKALETNDFTVFPGEAYTLGFIRNYAEFLKIDPENVIKLFYTHQISESETPIEELVAPTRPRLNPIPIILLIVIISGIVIGIFLALKPEKRETNIQTSSDTRTESQQPIIKKQVAITNLPFYSTKTIGDELFIKIKEKIIKINIKKIDQKSITIIFSSVGENDFLENLRKEFTIELDKQLKFDFDKNKEYDFSIGVESLPSPAQVKLYLRKIEEPYENQRYYDFFTYQKPDQATLTQLQQSNQEPQQETNQTTQNRENQQAEQQLQLPQIDQTNQQPQVRQTNVQSQLSTQTQPLKKIKLDVAITNSMQRDGAIYIWVKKDSSNEIRTFRLVKDQSIKFDAENKLTIDTNNLFGLKIIVNGKELDTKNISNDGGVGKVRLWIDKNPQGKTEIKWEINR